MPWLESAVVVGGFAAIFALLRGRVDRTTWLALLLWATASTGVTFGFAQAAGDRERARLKGAMQAIVPTYARALSELGYARISLDTPPDDPHYTSLIALVYDWQASNPTIADVYTFGKRPDGQVVLVLDAETDYDHDGKFTGDRESRTAIGEPYDVLTPGMIRAFDGEVAFDDLGAVDRWGDWVNAFAPIRSPDGEILGICGVDYPRSAWLAAIAGARRGAGSIGILVTIIGLVAGVWAGGARAQAEDRREAADALAEAAERAEVAARAKSAFLGTMSHEIRTPLNGVLGMAQLLLGTRLDAQQRQYLDTICSSAEMLLQMIDTILDHAKATSGRLVLDVRPGDLVAEVEDVVRLLAAGARAPDVQVSFARAPGIPTRVRFDALRVRQIVTNLIGNAQKFTKRGRIEVEVCTRGPMIEISVSDTGIGIDADQLTRLFQPFTQADSGTTRRYGGTGLGLAICKQLVELMGGELGVESARGVGSRFWFRVPIEPVIEPAREPAPTPPTSPVRDGGPPRILLVEDNPVNQEVARELLRRLGCRVTVVETGAAGVEAAQSGVFDLVLMDGELPDIDGAEAARQIRSAEVGSRLPIVALSAYTDARSRGLFLAAGMDEHVGKPVRASELAAVLDRWIPRAQPRLATRVATGPYADRA